MNIKNIAIAAGLMMAMSPTARPQRIIRYINPDEEVKHPRNSPCVCGSGKKYKKCFLNKSDHA